MRLLALLVAVLMTVAFAPVAGDTAPDPRPAFGGLDAPLRPGSSLGGYCTFNFVFYDGVLDDPDDEPVAYIGTAGHCTKGVGEVVDLADYGPVGEVVYDSDDVGSGVDFSLIQIDRHTVAHTNPTMRGFDGPYGTIAVAEDLKRGDLVDEHGYGLVLGQNDVTRSRQGVLVDWSDDEYVVDGPFVNGDSGSPLLHDRTRKALGIISRYGFFATPPSTDTGPMLPWILRELAAAGFGDVVLADASP